MEFDPIGCNKLLEWRLDFERKMLDPWLDSTNHLERLWFEVGHLYWRMEVELELVVWIGAAVMAVEARLESSPLEYPLETQRTVSRCLERSWDHF